MLVRVGPVKWVNTDHINKIEARVVRSRISLRITFDNGVKDKIKYGSIEDRTVDLDNLRDAMSEYNPPGPG